MAVTKDPNAMSSDSGVADSDTKDLAAFGYTQRLRRSMTSVTSFCLAFSMITITGSLVGLFQPAFEQVGGVSVWLWLVGLVGVMPVLLVFMHMAARIPVTGYAYQWSSRITNPYYGWVVAVLGIITFTTGAVSIAVLLGSVYAPILHLGSTQKDAAYVAAGAVTLAVLINIIGIKVVGAVNNGAAFLEIGGTSLLAVLLLIGTVLFFKSTQGFNVIWTNHGAGGVNGAHTPFVNYILAALLPILSLLGWEASADLAEETQNPRKTAPTAMLRAVIVSGLAGFVVMWIFAAAISGSIPAALAQPNTMFWVVGQHLGGFFEDLLKVVGFASMMGCIIANVAVGTRLIYSVARDNMMPFSKQLSEVSRTFRTPVVAIVTLWVVMLIINIAGAGNIFRIIAMASVAYYFTYGATIIAVIIGDRRGTIPAAEPGHFSLGKKLIPVALLGLAWCVAVILAYMLPKVNHYVAGYFAVALGIGALFTIYAWTAIRSGRATVPRQRGADVAHATDTIPPPSPTDV
jgi:amino acid transporter